MKSVRKQYILCVLCPPRQSRRATESHHVTPVEFGGDKDGPQIPLCGTCHDRLHELSREVTAGKVSRKDIRNADWAKAVGAIVDSEALFRQNGSRGAVDARRRIGVSLTERELEAAHSLKELTGCSSLEMLLRQLLHSSCHKLNIRVD